MIRKILWSLKKEGSDVVMCKKCTEVQKHKGTILWNEKEIFGVKSEIKIKGETKMKCKKI